MRSMSPTCPGSRCHPAYRAAFAAQLIDLVLSYTTRDRAFRPVAAHPGPRAYRAGARRSSPTRAGQGSAHDIPVWYDPSVGPELKPCWPSAAATVTGVIPRHSRTSTRCRPGLRPGFAFMGLVEETWPPAPGTPRKRVAAGSVGIASADRGLPGRIAGGWNLIGHTPAPVRPRSGRLQPVQPG